MKVVVVHSGGMDSSLCLAIAKERWGSSSVESLSFKYDQRHEVELKQAVKISAHFGVTHHVIDMANFIAAWQSSALVDRSKDIVHEKGKTPNTFVVGRNGIFAHLAALWAYERGARKIYLGVMELESANSGYPDCSRKYMDLMEQVIRLDLSDPEFEICTPVIHMDKCSSLEKAQELGVLEFLLNETITCYEGIIREGCQRCPACKLRNEGIRKFHEKHPEVSLPYLPKSV